MVMAPQQPYGPRGEPVKAPTPQIPPVRRDGNGDFHKGVIRK